MNLIDELQFRKLLDKMDSLERKIDAMRSDTCWVSRSAYCKYNGVSRSTLYRSMDYLEQHNAVKGCGKAARFNKFFPMEKEK